MDPKSPVTRHLQDGIARVTLDRALSRNALNLEMCHALREAFEQLDADEAIRVVLLDAKGSVFCAGADLKERQDKDAAWVRNRRLAAFAAYDAIARCGKPVVALVQGPVVGSGGEIAMSCDFIVATTAASFRFPEPQWGTVGATQRLQRVIGKRRAKELLFTGRAMPAEEAYTLGLVARLVAPDALVSTGDQIATTIAKAPPLAMQLTKQAVDLGENTELDTGIRVELAAIDRMLADGGWRQGVERFGREIGGGET